MNADRQTTGMNIKVKLSMLWIFVLFNMIYADIISLMDAVSPIRRIMEGAPMPPGGIGAPSMIRRIGDPASIKEMMSA